MLVTFGGYDLDGSKRLSDVEVTHFGSSNPKCQIPNLPNEINRHSTIKTTDGIISCGGYDINGHRTNRCHRLDLNNKSWSEFPAMVEKRYYFSMEGNDTHLFVVGGRNTDTSMEWIDVKEGKKWEKMDLGFGVGHHCITRYNNSHLLMTGGWLKDEGQSEFKVIKNKF